MKKLFARMQMIVGKKTRKLKELEATTPELIDCPILECEINDAKNIMLVIKADAPDEDKILGIKAINSQTTSASIYDSVNKYFEEEGITL